MKKILLIATGGTIASTDVGKGLKPTLDVNKVLAYLPELPTDCQISGVQLMNLDSTNIGRMQWNQLVTKMEEDYDQYDGFVIAHGTDTLAYTASALSYLIQESAKPIVITGAQHSLAEEGSDGIKNLYDAISLALDDKSHGVLVVFDGDVMLGTRVKKINSKSNHSMESINYPRLAVVKEGSVCWEQELDRVRNLPEFYHPKDASVHLIKVTPFIKSELLELVFHNYECVVLEGFGSGNLPDSLYQDLKFLSQMYETMVVVGTQVLKEGTDMSAYEVGKKYLELPQVVEAKDMTSEAVLAKVMWIQSQGIQRLEEKKKLFEQTIWYDRM